MDTDNVNYHTIYSLAIRVGQRLRKARLWLATAESCTGGEVAAAITAVAGSSHWFERGFVTYSNLSKTELLGVPAELMHQFGAVSEPVACAMAEGALRHSRAQVALAITGLAGPAGGTKNKPVGTVCFGFASRTLDCAHGHADTGCVCETLRFAGDRQQVRLQAVAYALRGILHCGRYGLVPASAEESKKSDILITAAK